MAQSIPFTIEHDHLLREHSRILNEHSRILDEHTQTLNEHGQLLRNHTERLDRLEVKVDHLETTMVAGFRRADVRHEELRAEFRTVIDLVLHTHQKLDALMELPNKVHNHDIRIGAIESHLQKDA